MLRLPGRPASLSASRWWTLKARGPARSCCAWSPAASATPTLIPCRGRTRKGFSPPSSVTRAGRWWRMSVPGLPASSLATTRFRSTHRNAASASTAPPARPTSATGRTRIGHRAGRSAAAQHSRQRKRAAGIHQGALCRWPSGGRQRCQRQRLEEARVGRPSALPPARGRSRAEQNGAASVIMRVSMASGDTEIVYGTC